MPVHEAQPMDVYTDENGKLWRVVGIFGEPAVIVEEIESKSPESPVRMTGGVSGLMWNGFKRVVRYADFNGDAS